MQAVDNNQASNSIKGKLNSIKVYNDVSKSEKDLKTKTANSEQSAASKIAEQLDKVAEQKKRYEKKVPNSMDEVLSFIGITSGKGNETTKYLREKILQAAVQVEPEIKNILNKETLKALGCDQEQTYDTVDETYLKQVGLPQIPNDDAIYIPIQSLDLFGLLKQNPNNPVGRVLYEKDQPNTLDNFINYGGEKYFPMNKTLYDLTQNPNSSFDGIFNNFYQGETQQRLFDIGYATTNQFGVTGNYLKVVLIKRDNIGQSTGDIVGNFLVDYYSTIKVVDFTNIGAQLMNLLTGALSTASGEGAGDVANQSVFFTILQRIFGLCFDARKEIDVSGTAKVAELDGIDDSFYRLTESDLRNIEVQISNVQNGVIEFVDCDNVKLPVDVNNILTQLTNLRENAESKPEAELVKDLENIIDSAANNPAWNNQLPSNFSPGLAINQNVLKLIPSAVVAAVLTPKVLLPIFILLGATQNKASLTYNNAVGDINEVTGQTSNDLSNIRGKTSNIVEDPLDFLKKFKSFSIEVASQIFQIFLKTLFEILKRDILNLIRLVIKDIGSAKLQKQYQIILRLLDIANIISALIVDFRKCKSLLDSILNLLKLIQSGGLPPGNPATIPPPLLFLAPFLPGTSTQRSLINTIETMQSLGLPTGPLPDGSPNLMVQYANSIMQGMDKEQAENGKVEGFGIVPPVTGGYVQIFAKSF